MTNLTESEINELRGLELRAAVATEIMKLPYVQEDEGRLDWWDELRRKSHPVPAYERDHNAMMSVMAEMKRKYGVLGEFRELRTGGYLVKLKHDNGAFAVAEAESLPVAALHAALLFVATQGEK